MGAVSQREDAEERLSSALFDASEHRISENTPRVEGPPVYPCPHCSLEYLAEDALSAHVFVLHAGEGFYVRLNGSVPPDTAIVLGQIWQFEVVATGTASLALKVTKERQKSEAIQVRPDRPTSLLATATELGPGQSIEIWRTDGGGEPAFTLYKDSAPDLDLDALDPLIMAAQSPLWLGEMATWPKLMEAERSASGLEGRYLRGFAEYFLGVEHEVFRHDYEPAKGEFEAAFGHLRVFGTSLARAAYAVLAFRMEAYGRVRRLGPGNTLWAAAHYFASPQLQPDLVPDFASSGPDLSSSGSGIWIDACQDGLIRTASAALRGDPVGAYEEWKRLPEDLILAPGNRAKRNIAGARLARANGDEHLSRSLFRELAEYPRYASEALASL